MAFSREVKRELAAVLPAAAHCRRAQLSGLLFGAGTFEIGAGGQYALRLSFALPAVARHALALLKPFGVGAVLRTVDSAPAGRRYEVLLGGEPRDLQLLNELGVLSDALRVQLTAPARLVHQHCCLVAFLRGVFLGCGTVSSPGAPVHLELTVEDADLARQLQAMLGRLDLDFHLAERGRNVACYTKRSETASALLAVLGAHDACLRWEEHAVMGEMRGRANRLANCDEANARRAASAGERQADAARRLMAAPAWGTLPGSVREAAELRLAYPYLSLSELAARAEPALSRSALNHRLRRLVALADELEG